MNTKKLKNKKPTKLSAVFMATDNDDLQERQSPSSDHRIVDPNVIIIEDDLQERQPLSSDHRIVDPNVIIIEDDLRAETISIEENLQETIKRHPPLQASRAMPRILNVEILRIYVIRLKKAY